MPIHDWNRVDAGIFHDFHIAWIGSLLKTLNSELLPPDYYVLAETAEREDSLSLGGFLNERFPKVSTVAETEARFYASKQRNLVIRHSSGNRIVAILEIVSEANKSSRHRFGLFLEKALSALEHGIHLLLIDLQPPSPRDPRGIHDVPWQELAGECYQPPPGKDRTLVAYTAGLTQRAYIEPVAVGQPLTPMPLFLTTERYVNVPLEETYQAAYEGVPRIYRQVLDVSP